MKVKELVEKLNKYSPDQEVYCGLDGTDDIEEIFAVLLEEKRIVIAHFYGKDKDVQDL